MKAYLARRYHFSASHRLFTGAYSEERNREVYGKCANPHGHGHNYVVDVIVGGSVAADTGMVCDLGVLDGIVRERIVKRFDHTNLNLDPLFQSVVSTTENLCIAIYTMLHSVFEANALGTARLTRVRVEETQNNFFEYAGQ